jgi:leucyl-tRNA synthetase
MRTMLLLLSPMIPHACDELWERLGYGGTASAAAWPSWSEELAKDDMLTIVIQINGKLRSQLTVPATATEDEIKSLALSDERAMRFAEGRQPKKVIYVRGKLVNVVV